MKVPEPLQFPLFLLTLAVVYAIFIITLLGSSQEPEGVCLHEFVVWPEADSVGVAWTYAPCAGDLDIRNPVHSISMRRSILHLPKRCGLVYHLPGIPGPIVDTTSVSFACARE